jgi:hypothetical protein
MTTVAHHAASIVALAEQSDDLVSQSRALQGSIEAGHPLSLRTDGSRTGWNSAMSSLGETKGIP